MKKIDKVVGIIYCLFVIIYIILILFALFLPKYDSLGLEAVILLPIFIILEITYRQHHKSEIDKTYHNKFTRILKYVSILLFLISVFTFVITANVLNKSLTSDYIHVYENEFNVAYFLFTEVYRFVWPVIFIFFAINYKINKNSSLRSENLRDLLWAVILVGILTLFSKMIGIVIYDIELLLILSIK